MVEMDVFEIKDYDDDDILTQEKYDKENRYVLRLESVYR